MVIRKITIDNSVEYVPITEKDNKQNTTKIRKVQPNKTKHFQKIIKKFVKDFTASGFRVLTK